jgi:hypothetical protein
VSTLALSSFQSTVPSLQKTKKNKRKTKSEEETEETAETPPDWKSAFQHGRCTHHCDLHQLTQSRYDSIMDEKH